MTRAPVLLALLATLFWIGGCSKSGSQSPGPQTAKMANELCTAMKETGLAKQCTVSDRDNAVNVVTDTDDDEQARRICADLAGRMAALAEKFSPKPKLKIFSPYRSDKVIATCSLDTVGGSVPY